jgi:error-prone DNA polymerase
MATRPFAELLSRTHWSFLEGASRPGELITRASELGLHALGISDRNGVYGIPKAYRALRENPGTRLLCGAEVTLSNHVPITFLARDRAGWGLLCRMLTASHADKPKGEASLTFEELLSYISRNESQGLICLPRDPLIGTSGMKGDPNYGILRECFGGERLAIPLMRVLDGRDTERTFRSTQLAGKYEIPILATNDVHVHHPERRPIQDIFAALRHSTTLPKAGQALFQNAERYLKSPQQMEKLFRDMPEAIDTSIRLAELCHFSPSELRYRYPSEWIPKGKTAQAWLEELTWKGAQGRYPDGIPPEVEKQLKHEFSLIEQMQFADYFLTIWEIVEFARSRDILCQGRGSAANSAVCWCLGITAIDPVRMGLLFERFISTERGEPPDIDVDFEHDRREEVIQHIYEKYGRDRAAMVSAVITYRSKLARREVSKVLELPLNTQDALAEKLMEEIEGFPRHLSIHSGGFTLSQDPLIETVPVEPARMEGRSIVQWDKEDLETIGLLKVDILALGMLSALHRTLDFINARRAPDAQPLTLAGIPAEDHDTYEMIRRADTVGTFQIESRAQMSMLPRLQPRTFYDLVVQVAIVRPGPIQGGMVHPYLRRRRGLEAPDMPDPRLGPILGKTLGVPLFQEQVMKIAILLADFTPGQADELRRAIGAWRSTGSIHKMGQKLMEGLRKNGLPQEFAERIFLQIQGFAQYGFPESHAASFALIAYASAWLKRHHPAEFCAALINSQPMGFYAPHTLLDDAKRHGVNVLPPNPHQSDWHCTLTTGGAIQVGLCTLQGIRKDHVLAMERARADQPFESLRDFLQRTRFPQLVLHRMALGDFFRCFGSDQRHSLWEILSFDFAERTGRGELIDEGWNKAGGRAEQLHLNFHSGAPSHLQLALFQGMDRFETLQQDYAAYSLSTRGHPMGALRQRLGNRLPELRAADIKNLPPTRKGKLLETSGLIIILQRPGTAKGVAFATLEDETGFIDIVFHEETYLEFKEVLLTHSFVCVQGVLQRDGQAVSLLVKKVEGIPIWSIADSDSLAPESPGSYITRGSVRMAESAGISPQAPQP